MTSAPSIRVCSQLQDQPEHCGSNYLMLGSGKYSARWGHSCNIGLIAKHLPSCDSCKVLNSKCLPPPSPGCSFCTNWEVEGTNVLLRTLAPNGYPVYDVSCNDGHLLPFKLSYNILNGCIATAHMNYVSGQWTTENVRQYLHVHCINKEGIELVLRNAQNTKMLKSLEGNAAVLNQYEVLLDHRSNNSEMYDCWKGPALWTCQCICYS